jgi:hypothetical protein
VRLLQEVQAQAAEAEHRRDPEGRQSEEHDQARARGQRLRTASGDESPVDGEAEQPVPEVVAGGEDAGDVERLHGRARQLLAHVLVGTRRAQVVGVEARAPGVEQDVEHEDHAGGALHQVLPVARVAVLADVRLPGRGDQDAQDHVEQDGQPDAERFERDHERDPARVRSRPGRTRPGPAASGRW